MLRLAVVAQLVLGAIAPAPARALQSSGSVANDSALRAQARADAIRRDPRVAWLKRNAIRVRSISPDDDDFRDLAPLRDALAGVRIVLLGEADHGSGSDFLAKTRLVEFLHRELGFDVLAFEAGMHGMAVAWDSIRAGAPVAESFALGAWGMWSNAAQVRPLLAYVADQAGGDRPLELAGFDNQFKPGGASVRFAADLARFLAAHGIGGAFAETASPERGVLESLATMRYRRGEEALPEPGARRAFLVAMDRAVAAAASRDGEAASFWAQVLRGTACHARRVFAELAAEHEAQRTHGCLREGQMADHLLWLANERHAGRKIIVWAATGHVMRSPDIRPTLGVDSGPSLGQRMWDALGEETYAIGTTSYRGTHGFPNADPQHIVADQDPEPEFEELMAAAGFDYALVDLRAAAREGSWAGGAFHARPHAHLTREAIWSEALDALFFIRRQEQSRRAGQEPPPTASASGAAFDHRCLVLPGSWANATHSFMIRSDPDAGQLAYVSEAAGGAVHQRAAIHPDGRTLYLSATTPRGDSLTREIHAFAYRFDPETCAIGPKIDSITGPGAASIMRYYGLEMHPGGRFLYQTTEAGQGIRFHRVGDDGGLSLVETYDVTRGGRHTCAQARRLEMHPDGRTLYSNCNNSDAGEHVDHAVQAWRVGSDGRLAFLDHHGTPAMDAGVFDPVVHPDGRWLYQPLASGERGAPGGSSAYVLLYDIAADGRLEYRSAVRVPDPDADLVDDTADLPFTALPTTVLIHPDGTHAYVTVHDQVRFTHQIAVYRIDPRDGSLTHVSARNTATAGMGNHQGGVLARRGGRTFLYTFVNVFPGPEGFIEQYQITEDYRLRPLDPVRMRPGLRHARHPIVVTR